MKVMFLGTAAAEGFPGLWCTCERCQASRAEGGRSRRLRTMLLIDDRLLIDCGPDLVAAAIGHNLDLSGVRTLLITHEHSDHLYLPNLEVRRAGFCATPLPTLHVYGSAGAIERIRSLPFPEEALHLQTHVVRPFETWESDGYRILALPARHGMPPLEPLFYALSDGRVSLLYAHDTGPFPEETWAYLLNPPDGQRWRFDLVSIDSTMGLLERPGTTHMTLAQVREHRDRLQAAGLLAPGARVIANHFSHNGTPSYRALVEHLAGSGLEPAYDGLTVVL